MGPSTCLACERGGFNEGDQTMEKLMTAKDVADVLNLQRSTVYSLVRRGVLPHVRLTQGIRRSMVRFRPEDIDRLIKERTCPVRKGGE